MYCEVFQTHEGDEGRENDKSDWQVRGGEMERQMGIDGEMERYMGIDGEIERQMGIDVEMERQMGIDG